MSHVIIEGLGTRARVLVAGKEVYVREVTLHWEAGYTATLTIELDIAEIERLADAEVQVILPTHTVDALKALGWRPPGDGS